MRVLEVIGALMVSGALGLGVYYFLLNFRWGRLKETDECLDLKKDKCPPQGESSD